jgi:hypothetical protein
MSRVSTISPSRHLESESYSIHILSSVNYGIYETDGVLESFYRSVMSYRPESDIKLRYVDLNYPEAF